MMRGAEEQIRLKMENRGIAFETIGRFLEKVAQARGEPSYVPLSTVSAPDSNLILEMPSVPEQVQKLRAVGAGLMHKAVVIKLNGGRSTTMGGGHPKGVLVAKDGMSYVEIIIRQIQALRKEFQVEIPLILMNSFFTHVPTMEIVKRFDLPVLTFMQNQVPRLDAETLAPLDTGTEEDWTPTGHGDVYASLHQTGMLEDLRSQGYRWAFISNLDNLAAYLDVSILGMIGEENIEFLLEVTDRTMADRKGGTLVARDGHLDLLEIAQVSPEERDGFMDISRFRVFNTNNVWIDLDALAAALDSGLLRLPLIQNRKTVMGSRVIQIETAMGAAIGCFPKSKGLRVGRDRFFPTKKVEDLFVLRSDACVLDAMFRLHRNPDRPSSLPFLPHVVFSQDFLDTPEQLKTRFEDPATTSLVRAHSFKVSGPAYFERNVRIEGKVEVHAPPGNMYRIPRETVLKDGTFP